jgi:hypothetical protein
VYPATSEFYFKQVMNRYIWVMTFRILNMTLKMTLKALCTAHLYIHSLKQNKWIWKGQKKFGLYAFQPLTCLGNVKDILKNRQGCGTLVEIYMIHFTNVVDLLSWIGKVSLYEPDLKPMCIGWRKWYSQWWWRQLNRAKTSSE